MYTPEEIARAAGVPVTRVIAALDGEPRFISHADAVTLGRALVHETLFTMIESPRSSRHAGVPLAVSGSLHAGVIVAVVLMLALGPAPVATTLHTENRPEDDVRLVFLNIPGPGGGGGGGGALEVPRPPKLLRQGRASKSDLIPAPPPTISESEKETPKPPEP